MCALNVSQKLFETDFYLFLSLVFVNHRTFVGFKMFLKLFYVNENVVENSENCFKMSSSVRHATMPSEEFFFSIILSFNFFSCISYFLLLHPFSVYIKLEVCTGPGLARTRTGPRADER